MSWVHSTVGKLLAREEVRYVLVAGGVAVLYLGLVATWLATGLAYMLAILVAQVVTISIAFPLYRKLVFRSSGPVVRDFWRFLTVWSTGAIASFGGTPFLVEVFHMHPMLAQTIVMVTVSVGSFLAHRLFTFSNRHVQVDGQARS